MSKRAPGQIRQSQLITTFGPGSMLDLPNYSVLVGGLDFWSPQGRTSIQEPRLVEKLKQVLEVNSLALFTPPPEDPDPTAPQTGITAWQFPNWFITQDVEEARQEAVRSRLLVPRIALTRSRWYVDDNRKRRSVVPVRFVRACRRGHIEDIDWYAFVHGGATPCRRPLWIDERGTTGDLSEVWVRCECGKDRAMIEAGRMETKALGNCDGARPWLGPYTKESCGEPNRLLIRTASNAYFAQLMSVISLPEGDEGLSKAVDEVWQTYLQYVATIEDLRDERRKKPPVKNALEGFSDEDLFAEIQRRKGGGGPVSTKSVKQVEIETLLSARDEVGVDRPDGNYYARALPPAEWRGPAWMTDIDRVVLVHRLREVVALVGFTRFEAAAPDTEGELELGVKRAALARETTWLPAIENRGEGIFLSVSKGAIESWLQKPEVRERGRQLEAGFNRWLQDHQGSKRLFPGLPYILVHSLSHLLITAVSLECGYPASSIRERIYAGSSGYGILLFTGSSDAEGTMGGLVEAGREIARHMRMALELAELCSNDPVCAQHDPGNPQETRFLLGAACHGCLLIAETCCEQYNDFLDRALVVPTIDNRGAAFFRLGD